MIEIDFAERVLKGTCKAGDVRRLGLLQASINAEYGKEGRIIWQKTRGKK